MNNNEDLFDCDKNHIYFYCEVNNKTCLLLNKKIKELNTILLKQSIDHDIEPVNIYLHINSGGGSLFAAFSTIDTIINSQIPIVSIIEGSGASAATLISIVCHERFITENSYMLIHQLSSFNKGKYDEMKDEFLKNIRLWALQKHIEKNKAG
jgi:ATP-dependent protease ClpP protease subunit